jgi:archaellum component FlaC
VAQRKKTAAQSASVDARAFTVVLEDLHAKFDVFGEALQGVRSEVAEVRSEVAELRSDVAALQSLRPEVAALRDEVREIREEVAEVRNDVGVLRRDVELLKVAVVDNVREIKQLRRAR